MIDKLFVHYRCLLPILKSHSGLRIMTSKIILRIRLSLYTIGRFRTIKMRYSSNTYINAPIKTHFLLPNHTSIDIHIHFRK